MKEMLEALREASRKAIEDAGDMEALEALRIRYLGKKGELTAILKQMGRLSAEERPVIGQLANQVRAELESELDSRKTALAAKLQELKLQSEALDVTMPGRKTELGAKHVINTVRSAWLGNVSWFVLRCGLRDGQQSWQSGCFVPYVL